MELRVPHMLHLFNIYHENKDSDNYAQVLEEECIRMFGSKYFNVEHYCNVFSMNSLNIMFDEDDIFVPQVLRSKFILMIACLLFMMIILMKVGLEECQL